MINKKISIINTKHIVLEDEITWSHMPGLCALVCRFKLTRCLIPGIFFLRGCFMTVQII